MNIFKKFIKLSALSTLIGITSFSTSYAKPLTGAEIKALIGGKRVNWVTPKGFKGYTNYKKNGTATVVIKSPKKFKDKGTWRVKANKICNKWNKIRDNEEKCFSLLSTDKSNVLKGQDGGVWTIK